jgi:phenylacetate-CoA ligase
MIERMQTPEQLRTCFARLRTGASKLAALPLDALLSRLERLSQQWRPGSASFQRASQMLGGVFGPYTVEAALKGLAMSLHAPILRAELARELGRADLLDIWQPDEYGIGWARGYPLGVVAQVLAGNVFLGGVIALAQALLTRNAVLLKLSTEDSGFTELFTQTLLEADDDSILRASIAGCSWSSAQEEFNQVVREEADAVVVWGGASAVNAYPAERCRGRVIHYGPRLGIGFVLNGVDLPEAIRGLAWDVALWEQRACSSPRLLFVEDIGDFPRQVAARLSQALMAVRERLPARPLTLDDKAEVLAIRELANWQDHAVIFAAAHSMDHTVLLTEIASAEVPLGYRTICVIPFRGLDGIADLLTP